MLRIKGDRQSETQTIADEDIFRGGNKKLRYIHLN